MERPLVIYHANCLDGFGAAFAAFSHFRQGDDCPCDFVAASYGQHPPEVTGRDVYIVDFSYRRQVLQKLCRSARSVTVIDHHISAERDLAGLEREHANLRVVFDMDKSGAVLAWEYFHRKPPPRLLLHIQDRDLWRFELEGTNDIYAALMARPYDFRAWAELVADGEAPALLAAEGRAINRYRRVMIDMHRNKAVMGTIDGCQVPVVNCYEEIASDLLAELAAGPSLRGRLPGPGDPAQMVAPLERLRRRCRGNCRALRRRRTPACVRFHHPASRIAARRLPASLGAADPYRQSITFPPSPHPPWIPRCRRCRYHPATSPPCCGSPRRRKGQARL